MERNFSQRIYRLVGQIPPGKVMTYGAVAEALGHPRAGRAVGTALKHCGECPGPVPWHRVLGAGGRPSRGGDPKRPEKQRKRLEKEGVFFKPSGACDLETHEWIPSALKRRVLEGKSLDSADVWPR